MFRPVFAVRPLGGNCFALDERERTVATVSSQGYIDWLLPSPRQAGPLVTALEKEPHLSYVLGLKLLLITPHPATLLTECTFALEEEGARLVIRGCAQSADGNFRAETTAELTADAAMDQYRWTLTTRLTCTAEAPTALQWIEFNNVYPGKAGRCMLYAPQKEFTCTLMVDEDGVIWRFPHQHLLHYTASGKIPPLHFLPGTLAGFFGDPSPAGAPVVIIDESPLEPDWAICDMYYDLHCGARPTRPLAPGEVLTFRYRLEYLPRPQAAEFLAASRPVPITVADWERHTYPRLELGMNRFADAVMIDGPDDASGFRPQPPQKVWDRAVGHRERGALRLTNPTPQETVWSAEPPTQIPASTRLRVRGLVKTEGVTGPGLSLRLRYHTFVWHPTPHVEWVETLVSPPVSGTTDAWVPIEVPELRVPADHRDYLLWIDVILDGQGVAWLTDMDVDLQPELSLPPVLQEGGQARRQTPVARRPRSGTPAR
jgi:hypothetical protein